MTASLSVRLLPLLALSLSAALAAQQRVCMSLHAGPAVGTNTLGAPAQVAGRVNGTQVSVPTAAGMTAAQASAAHQAAFTAAGFTTEREAGNLLEFCVTAGPGGAPITSGLCYGTDDMGLDLDSSVSLIPPVPPGGGAVPGGKPGGAVVPLPPVQQPPLPSSGQIVVCFWVWAANLRVRICVPILLQMLPGAGLQQSIEQQLQQHGLRTNRIKAYDPLHPTLILDALQIDRTASGDLVDGVEYQYDPFSRRILPNVTGAGLVPLFGSAEYGVGTRGNAPIEPWSHLGNLPPMLNSFFDVFHQLGLPNLPGALAIGFAPAILPLFNGTLLVDPSAGWFEFTVSDAQGTIQRHWQVPNDPQFLGAALHEQAGVLDASMTATMSTAIRAVVGN